MVRRSPTLAVVHNIPSPYRLHLFRSLNQECEQRGLGFIVHFQSEPRGDLAYWAPVQEALDFPHRFWRDWGRAHRDNFRQLNPGLVSHLLIQRYEALLLGGPLVSPTALLLSLLGSATAGTRVAWVELYRGGPQPGSPWKRALARFLMKSYDHFAVPGEEAILTIERDGYGRRDRCLLLPNLVDESLFGEGQDPAPVRQERLRALWGCRPHRKLALWPARLIPVKGILPFLGRLSPDLLDGWDVVIIGNGSLRKEVEETIAHRGLAGAVRVVPVVKYEDMPAVYKMADLFLLPSLHDPNPLSVVEALWSGLPLLVSNRIGNLPEALKQGENGWCFDPEHGEEILDCLRRALGSSRETLESMGAVSRQLAAGHWSTNKSVRSFISGLFPGAR